MNLHVCSGHRLISQHCGAFIHTLSFYLSSTYCSNISEKLAGLSHTSSGQDGSASSQSTSYNVWILESHVD